MALPYENTTSGEKAIAEIQKILRNFGCQQFGSMVDDENKKIILQFKYRNMQISVEASIKGYAALWLKAHPWSHRMRKSKVQHERQAMEVGSIAVYSILRDWIKGQTMAVESGILSFEGAFLGQILLGSGRSVLQFMQEEVKLLPAPENAP